MWLLGLLCLALVGRSSCLRCYTCSTILVTNYSGATPAPSPLRTGSPRWFFSLYDNCNDSSSAFLAVNWMNLLSAGWKSNTCTSQETKTHEGLCKDHDTVGPIVNCTDPRWEIRQMYWWCINNHCQGVLGKVHQLPRLLQNWVWKARMYDSWR